MGSELFGRMICYLEALGVNRIGITTEPCNVAMAAVARKHGMRLDRLLRGVEGRLELPPKRSASALRSPLCRQASAKPLATNLNGFFRNATSATRAPRRY
ncbi:GNAT family N-acetyltransferase [Alkalilimnicola ehrlichii]|uniref:GNAT family N-acetyltransferase n=1 Tax=Alkalilimnicola ehrlichii TaxID=351052 RepID=UPI002163DDD3|nr:GNAT family protein [Alkalilimnicola ehrlichii]